MNIRFRHWIALVALLLFVTWLGARRLNADGVWYDEWWSWYGAGASHFGPPLSPADIWDRLSAEDPWQIPGYAWTLAAWGSLVGWTEYAGRALSLLAGVLAVAVVYRSGRLLSGDSRVGLGAAVLLGGSGWFLFYLHELRVFALYTLLSALFLLLYWHLMTRQRPPGVFAYLVLVLVTSALIYCHYFALIPVTVVGLWHLARLVCQRPDRRWWMVLVCLALAGLTLLPWLNNVLQVAVETQGLGRFRPVGLEVLTIAGDMLYVFANASVALFALLAVFSLSRRTARGLWLLAMAVIVLNLVAYQVFRLNEVRYSMNVLPVLALIGGFGLAALAQPRWLPVVIAGLWIGGALAVDNNFAVEKLIQRTPPQPIREMASLLSSRLQTDDVVIDLLGNGMISIIYANPLVHYFGSLPGRKEIVEIDTLPSIQAYVDRVYEAVGEARRVWVLYDPRWPSSEWSLFIYLLNQRHIYECATLADRDDMRVLAFGRIDESSPVMRFDEQIEARLIGAPLGLQGDVLPVWLGFKVDSAVPPDSYSVGLHVIDPSGGLRAQADYGLPGTGESCRMVEIPTRELPPGDYRIQLIVYDWRTGERLPGVSFDGVREDSLTLAMVTKP